MCLSDLMLSALRPKTKNGHYFIISIYHLFHWVFVTNSGWTRTIMMDSMVEHGFQQKLFFPLLGGWAKKITNTYQKRTFSHFFVSKIFILSFFTNIEDDNSAQRCSD